MYRKTGWDDRSMREKPSIPEEHLRACLHVIETQQTGSLGGSRVEHALRSCWMAHQPTIHTLLTSLEELAGVLQERSGPHVICHADLHPGNMLRDQTDHVFVIDWDDVMDAAFWRRELVGANLMQRENGFYWRMPLKEFPTDPAKRSIILRWLANQLEGKALYRESEVDAMIAGNFPHVPTLRQELLDAGFIGSEDSLYWKL